MNDLRLEKDKYQMQENIFIWGYNRDPNITSSFLTWDDAYVYFNQKTNKYYMTLDTGPSDLSIEGSSARVEVGRLDEIKKAFRNFLLEKGLPLNSNIFPFIDPALEAESLSELYVKLTIMIAGYRAYRLNLDIIN